jgi:hypothetical protein
MVNAAASAFVLAHRDTFERGVGVKVTPTPHHSSADTMLT